MSKERKKLTTEEKLNILKRFEIIMAAATFITASGMQICTRLIKDNPYDGSSITQLSNRYRKTRSKSFLDETGFIPTFFEIGKLSEKEQDAYLLYYSLISNFILEEDVKKEVRNYINYAIDNPYIDYQYIYEEFRKVISKKVLGFEDPSVLGNYNHDTHVMKYKDINVTLHELLHADSKDSMTSWFEEALTALIDDEYNDAKNTYSYPFLKNILRILCEIIGKERARDVLFICEKEGNINLLKEELYKLNISGEEVSDLLGKLDKYASKLRTNYLYDNTEDLKILEKEIRSILAYFYIKTNGEENKPFEFVLDYFYFDILDLNIDKIYYLNSNKINENVEPYSRIYYYPYKDGKGEFEELKNLRTAEEREKNYSNYVIYIDSDIAGDYYFQISENELKLKNIIKPDNVILKVKKYYKGKTIIEYYKHEKGDFILYKTEEKEIKSDDIKLLATNYEDMINNKGGKING